MSHLSHPSGTCHEDGRVPVAPITEILQALADPIRLEIVRDLAGGAGPRACGSFDLPLHKSTLSHHFKVLREAGLIEHRCQGTWKLISLRRAEVDALYPGLIDSVVRAAPPGPPAAVPAITPPRWAAP
jgi:DNA-binding transcriptional ArsR family regulator